MNTTLEIPRTLGRRRAFASIMAAVSILLGCAWAGASAPTPAAALSCSLGPSLTPLAEANGIFCGGPEATGFGGFTGTGPTRQCLSSPDLSSLPLGFVDYLNNPSTRLPSERETGGIRTQRTDYFKNGKQVGWVEITVRSFGFELRLVNSTVAGYTQTATYSCHGDDSRFLYRIESPSSGTPDGHLAPGTIPTVEDGRVTTAVAVSALGASGRSLVRLDISNIGSDVESPLVTFDETAYEILDFPTLSGGSWCQQLGGARACTLPDIAPGTTRTLVALVKPVVGTGPDSTVISVVNSGIRRYSSSGSGPATNHVVSVSNSYLVPMR